MSGTPPGGGGNHTETHPYGNQNIPAAGINTVDPASQHDSRKRRPTPPGATPIIPTPLWALSQLSASFNSTFFIDLSDRAGCDGDGSSSLGPGLLERPVTFV